MKIVIRYGIAAVLLIVCVVIIATSDLNPWVVSGLTAIAMLMLSLLEPRLERWWRHKHSREDG